MIRTKLWLAGLILLSISYSAPSRSQQSDARFAQYIPTGFWRTNAAASPTPPLCASGGFAYEGYCYWASSSGGDCLAACSAQGGCITAGLAHIKGNLTKCRAVLTGLGYTTSGSGSNTANWPCGVTGTTPYTSSGTSSCSATNASTVRACACGAGGLTQVGAAQVNGYNYRIGASTGACDTTCSSYGGCNLAGTVAANSSDSNCTTILQALGESPSGNSTFSGSYGCSMSTTVAVRTSTPTCAATGTSGRRRVCACNNP